MSTFYAVSALVPVEVAPSGEVRYVPFAIWCEPLPEGFQEVETQLLQQLNESLQIGADIVVLTTGESDGLIMTPETGHRPSLAPITIEVDGMLVNLDPNIDAPGLPAVGSSELVHYVESNLP